MNNSTLPFKFIFNTFLVNLLCKKIPNDGTLDPEESLTLIGIYESQYHSDPKLSTLFFKQLKYAPNQKTARLIFTAVYNWELRRAGHKTKKEAINCILNTSRGDIELKKWILDVLDWGVLSNSKEKIKNQFPAFAQTDKMKTTFDFMKSAGLIFMFYWDVLKDVAMYSLFNHMSLNILVTKRIFDVLNHVCNVDFHFSLVNLNL